MSMYLVVLLLSLITVGEGVEVGVVEQGVVTITPGEGLKIKMLYFLQGWITDLYSIDV